MAGAALTAGFFSSSDDDDDESLDESFLATAFGAGLAGVGAVLTVGFFSSSDDDEESEESDEESFLAVALAG